MKNEDGMAFMKKLLAEADVFVNNLRDKALIKMGLDYPTLSKEFPNLIWAQMRGYGEYGPEKDSPGFDCRMLGCSWWCCKRFPVRMENLLQSLLKHSVTTM